MQSIEMEAESLERLSIKLLQEKNWGALEAMLDPACQFVNYNGSFDRSSTMAIMKKMDLGPVEFKDFKITHTENNLIISFWLAIIKFCDDERLPLDFSPRLSIWRKNNHEWKCIAYADLIASA